MRTYLVFALFMFVAPMSFGAFKNPKCKAVTQKSWTSSYNNCMAAYKKEAVDKKLPAADNKELCECVTDEFFLKKDCETINELFKHMTAANAFDAKTAMTSAFSGPIGICKARIRDRIRATSHKAAVKAQAEAGIVPDPPPQKK